LTSLLSKAGITTSQLASALESNQSSQSNQGGPSGSGGNSAGGGLFNNGSVGLFRLFNAELGPTSSWFLPTALFGLFIGFFATRKRKSKWYALTDKQKETLLWAGWLIPVGGFFSVAGFFHSYYLDMMGAPIAALTGIAIVELVRSAKASKAKLNWANIVGALLVLATYGVQASFTYSTYKIPTLVVGVLAIAIALAWLIPSKHGLKARAAASIAVLSIFTFWWALTPTLSSESAETPTVGPSLYQSGGQGASGGMRSNLDTNVLKYTEAHQGSTTYLFATVSAGTSEPYIIQSGKAVMTLGGFSGSDPSITLAKFKTLVKEGKVKYFLAGGGMGAGGGSSSQISAIESWIEANAKKVTSVSSTSTSSTSSKTISASSTAPTGTAPTGTAPSEMTGTAPTGTAPTGSAPSGMTGTAPTGSAPSGAPTASSSAKTTSSSTSSTSASSTQSSGGPGGQQSTTLYDLTTITNFS
ncbi:MAG: 4-amino-4-deoxy-L-arabinose transferase, partial [Lactococcus sp.]